MAAPSAPSERKALVSPALAAWLRSAGRSLGMPLGSLVFAFVVGAIVIAITHGDPIRTYQDLLCGGFGVGCSGQALPGFQLNLMLINMTPLVLSGLAVALPFRAGLFNIGAGGQYLAGIVGATLVGVTFTSLPSVILLPLTLLTGIIFGALWAGIAGVLKALTGANEVVTTIMLNSIALLFVHYLVGNEPGFPGPLKIANQQIAESKPIAAAAQLPRLLPQSGEILGLPASLYTVNAGLILALVAAVVYWFLVKRTTLGYQIGVVGQSQRAARYAGISTRRTIIVTMLIAGAFAGLAGAIQISGLAHQLIGNNYDVDTTGVDGIAIALLGQYSAIGVILSALLFGGLYAAGSVMQSDAGISSNIVAVLQGLILLSIAANFLRTIRIRLPGLSQRPPAANTLPPESPSVLAEEGAATLHDATTTSSGEVER